MKTVKVNKLWLIKIVSTNRDGHRAQYERAFEGYRDECIRVLTENLAAFKAGKRTHLVWQEFPPEDHTKEYDRVLAMLDASVDNTVELTSEEFSQYVQDDWSWRERWMTSNTKYIDR